MSKSIDGSSYRKLYYSSSDDRTNASSSARMEMEGRIGRSTDFGTGSFSDRGSLSLASRSSVSSDVPESTQHRTSSYGIGTLSKANKSGRKHSKHKEKPEKSHKEKPEKSEPDAAEKARELREQAKEKKAEGQEKLEAIKEDLKVSWDDKWIPDVKGAFNHLYEANVADVEGSLLAAEANRLDGCAGHDFGYGKGKFGPGEDQSERFARPDDSDRHESPEKPEECPRSGGHDKQESPGPASRLQEKDRDNWEVGSLGGEPGKFARSNGDGSDQSDRSNDGGGREEGSDGCTVM